MKIAVISGGDIPSIWAHSINVMKHAEGFFKLNHDVEIFSISRFTEMTMKLKIKNIHDFYNINRNIKVNIFNDYSPSFFSKSNKLLEFFAKNINFLFPMLRKYSNPAKKISLLCKKSNFDLIYSRTYEGTLYNIQNKIPTILETHTSNIKKPVLQKLIKRSNSKYFRGIITIHNDLKQNFIIEGVASNKVLVLEDAVDLDKFNQVTDNKMVLREKLRMPLNKKIILYCGSLIAGKGIGIILETAKKFNQNNLFYIVGGKQENLNYWKKIAKQKNVRNVTFTGFVSHKFVPYYLKKLYPLVH